MKFFHGLDRSLLSTCLACLARDRDEVVESGQRHFASFMHRFGAVRNVLALGRSVQGVAASAVGPALRRHAERACPRGHSMASSGAGPVHTSIVRAVTEALAPVEIELIDDSASHAGHGGMKGREAIEVGYCCCHAQGAHSDARVRE